MPKRLLLKSNYCLEGKGKGSETNLTLFPLVNQLFADLMHKVILFSEEPFLSK